MIEYGGGINNGPAGQVAGNGGGGTPDLGTHVDFFSSVSNAVNDSVNFLSAQPLEVLVGGAIAIIVGLAILRRAF